MTASTVPIEETLAIERFRNVLRETLNESRVNNFYDRVHVLLYNQQSLLREWLEISTINAITGSNHTVEIQEQRQQEREAAMSESLTRHMRAFIHERANFRSIRERVSENERWGLSLLDDDGNIRAFLPLERVRDFDSDLEMEGSFSTEGHYTDGDIGGENIDESINGSIAQNNAENNAENDTRNTIENNATNNVENNTADVSRPSTPILEDYRGLLLSGLEMTDGEVDEINNNNNNDHDANSSASYNTGNVTPIPNSRDTKLSIRIAALYDEGSSFFRVIRKISDYEAALPSAIKHRVPRVACILRYIQLRSEYYNKMSTLSRLAIAYPCYQTNEERIVSFSRHDGHVIKEITPARYAEAGFFSYGEHDAVTCYFCAGTIANWLPHDDPWEVHANFFPDCMFVYLKRGKNYINLQLAGNKNIGPYKPAQKVDEDKSRYECKICLIAEISVVFKPCEHMITCYDCAPLFLTCPWCKTAIFDAVRCIIPT